MASLNLSTEEKHFIIAGVEEDFRTDGRSCEDYRMVTVETNVLSNTNGSAQVKLAGTNVLIGVKAVIDEPLPTQTNEGRIEFFVDCSANASPIFEGRGGDELALELSSALQRMFCKNTLNLASLCVIPGKTCWVLYIDALVLECGGNLFDAVSIGIKAALHNTRIPNLKIIGEGSEQDIEISDDPYDTSPLNVDNVPVMVTLNKIGNRYVVDATAEEEVCSDSQLLVSINEAGRVCSLQKHGRGGFHPDLLFEMMQVGEKIGKLVNKRLRDTIELAIA
ncbi:exosome complex component RRP42-like [Hydractinia symbiolongicarpus]|uniref:exosome complex component RRP42-like n=1 Tax=Hydractinia symbiolongicarpus TaxID=13093 RepID=UPI00254BFC53|nr:exosome complex component RRP42-like [Hydractinia symbiolongicarpus]